MSCPEIFAGAHEREHTQNGQQCHYHAVRVYDATIQ